MHEIDQQTLSALAREYPEHARYLYNVGIGGKNFQISSINDPEMPMKMEELIAYINRYGLDDLYSDYSREINERYQDQQEVVSKRQFLTEFVQQFQGRITWVSNRDAQGEQLIPVDDITYEHYKQPHTFCIEMVKAMEQKSKNIFAIRKERRLSEEEISNLQTYLVAKSFWIDITKELIPEGETLSPEIDQLLTY